MKIDKYKFEITDDVLESKIQEALDKFDKKNFAPLRDFLDAEHKLLRQNEIKKTNQADYVGLRRFIFTAINNLVEMDNGVKTTLFTKMKEDIDTLYLSFDEFVSTMKFADIVYNEQFVPMVEILVDVKSKLDEALENKKHYQALEAQTKVIIDNFEAQESIGAHEMEDYKAAKKQNVDALYYLSISKDATNELFDQYKFVNSFVSGKFLPYFKATSEGIIKDLGALINIKSYCLDQALWYYAEKSSAIQRFFKTASIQGNFSLKTYINYYLKNLDPNSGTKEEEIKFLSKAMRELE